MKDPRKETKRPRHLGDKYYRALSENMLDGFAYCKMLIDSNDHTADFLYLEVNTAFEKLTGLNGVVGKKVSEVLPGVQESDRKLIETYGRVASTGNPERLDAYLKALGMWLTISVYSPKKGFFVAVFENITKQKQAEAERENLIKQLQEALANVTSLRGLLPICASCKKIRDDKGYWNQLEHYLSKHANLEFSHGICPECREKIYANSIGKESEDLPKNK